VVFKMGVQAFAYYDVARAVYHWDDPDDPDHSAERQTHTIALAAYAAAVSATSIYDFARFWSLTASAVELHDLALLQKGLKQEIVGEAPYRSAIRRHSAEQNLALRRNLPRSDLADILKFDVQGANAHTAQELIEHMVHERAAIDFYTSRRQAFVSISTYAEWVERAGMKLFRRASWGRAAAHMGKHVLPYATARLASLIGRGLRWAYGRIGTSVLALTDDINDGVGKRLSRLLGREFPVTTAFVEGLGLIATVSSVVVSGFDLMNDMEMRDNGVAIAMNIVQISTGGIETLISFGSAVAYFQPSTSFLAGLFASNWIPGGLILLAVIGIVAAFVMLFAPPKAKYTTAQWWVQRTGEPYLLALPMPPEGWLDEPGHGGVR